MYTKKEVYNALHSMMMNELLNGTRFNGNNIDIRYIDEFIQRLFKDYLKAKNDIDEEKLDKLANEFADKESIPFSRRSDIDSFKAGYRKAKEESI